MIIKTLTNEWIPFCNVLLSNYFWEIFNFRRFLRNFNKLFKGQFSLHCSSMFTRVKI